MRFASLGSGSKGNATLVAHGDTLLLIDCGFPARELEVRLNRIGLTGKNLSGILVTHEHGDHISGVGAVSRRFDLPVWMTQGSFLSGKCGKIRRLNLVGVHERFTIGDITVNAYPVPHDAREPVQYVFEAVSHKLSILTDTGSITPFICDMLSGSDAMLLECNHDEQMLRTGPYPEGLKRRVGGDYGHLSNRQAGELLAGIDCSRLQHLVASHLSEENNRPELAHTAIAGCINSETQVHIARQDVGFEWLEVSASGR